MMISPKNKRDLFRIIPFGLIWFAASAIYLLLEIGLLYDLEFYPATGNPYEYGTNTIVKMVAAGFSGLLMGAFEIKILYKLFINQSFGMKLLCKTLIYIILTVMLVLIILAIGYSVQLNISLFNPEILVKIWNFLSSITFWVFHLYVAAMIAVSLFYSEVRDNLGMSVLNNFFSGKYHKPLQEERIFMFLDMKSSTSIAEKIGHVKYFEMLREYYSDLSDSIVEFYGEVYQYVGDEIVVSWKLKNGIRENNCLKCFFAMKYAISNHSEKYNSKFGVLPSFKAGLHLGKVTTGEVGVLKKEIVFSGDVLNTTARIQGLCNSKGVDILISEQLKNKMDLDTDFQIKSMGINELRGRDESIGLFTVQEK